MLLQFDGTLIIIAISFIIFVIIMQVIFYAPMTEVRQERSNYIDNNNNLAHQNREKAEIIFKDYDIKITQARVQGNSIVSQQTDEAGKEKLSKIQEKSKEITNQINSAREETEKDKNNAIELLKPQIVSLAHSISVKVLGEEVPISGISSDIIERALKE